MTEIVPAAQIEQIVGARRRKRKHLGRAVSAEQTVYILHSKQCVARHEDLRDCEYSIALDEGIELEQWPTEAQDKPVELGLWHRRLVPVRPVLNGSEVDRG